MLGEAAAVAHGGEAANEDTVVGRTAHAKTVAQESAAGERALRITGEDGDRLVLAAHQRDQLAEERALADAAGAGEGDDPSALRSQ
jgi:hypothetical protein